MRFAPPDSPLVADAVARLAELGVTIPEGALICVEDGIITLHAGTGAYESDPGPTVGEAVLLEDAP